MAAFTARTLNVSRSFAEQQHKATAEVKETVDVVKETVNAVKKVAADASADA